MSNANDTLAKPSDILLGSAIVPTGDKPAPRPLSLGYMGFRSESAKSKIGELDAADIGENEFYLGDVAGVVRVKPFEFHLLHHAYFGTHVDNNGAVDDIVLSVTNDLYKQKYRKHVIGLAAVAMGDGLALAQFNFRHGLAQAFERGSSLLDKGGPATDAQGWARRGGAQRKTIDAGLPPMFRFRLRVWGEAVPVTDGLFNKSHAAVTVTPESSFAAIKALTTGDGFTTSLEPAIKRTLARIVLWSQFAKLSDDDKAKTNLPT